MDLRKLKIFHLLLFLFTTFHIQNIVSSETTIVPITTEQYQDSLDSEDFSQHDSYDDDVELASLNDPESLETEEEKLYSQGMF